MQKVRDHCHYTGKCRGAAHSICNLCYELSKEIPVVFHDGSAYDYHFIIKQLAREFKGYFHCLGENTEKYITFSVPIKKVHDNDNDSDNDKDKNKVKTITYRLKFIDLCRIHYRVLHIIYLRLIIKILKNVMHKLKSFLTHINYVIKIIINLYYY